MGIIKRFTDIMEANINALLDKAEDPSKMIDQYIRNLNRDLEDVKAETAQIMAEEKRAKRELDECTAEIDKMMKYAQKAVAAGNDADAKAFLVKRNTLATKQESLQRAYELAADNSAKMRQMHDKLVQDISTLQARKDAIKAKVAVAKTQQKVNKLGQSIKGASANMSAIDRMEARANQMLDEANAMAELNQTANQETIEDLALKYDAEALSDVDDELAALKAQMGMLEEM